MLAGAGGVGLRSLASGLPIAWLRGGAAHADPPPTLGNEQFLILSSSSAGDPLNTTAPGAYGLEAAGAVYNPSPALAPTKMQVGATATTAAAPWATLPAWALARSTFFHHATYTLNHSDEPKVLRLMGAAKRLTNGVVNGEEMAVSAFAGRLAAPLGTLQAEPLSVTDVTMSYDGRALNSVTPTSLKQILGARAGVLGDLRKLRDRSLDEMNAKLKGAPAAQRRLLDHYANSQAQIRAIQESLLARLDTLGSDGPADQVNAAITLVMMKVSPVVVIGIPFGGDNHTDVGLRGEAAAVVDGVGTMSALLGALKTAGLEDRTTFAISNVFGRTFRGAADGRTHNADHNVTVIVGKNVAPSVVGALRDLGAGRDFGASAIDSSTGRPSPAGDVPVNQTLESMGKTLGAALGIDRATLDRRIDKGKVVQAALITAPAP
jgi:hypothetical protein